MDSALSPCKKTFPRSFTTVILSVLAFSLSLLLGILLADIVWQRSGPSFSVVIHNPYSGCALLQDYITRAAFLAFPGILYTIAVWLTAYVHFEKTALVILFSLRGICGGSALRLALFTAASNSIWLSIGAHTGISLLLLWLVFCIRRDDALIPLPDSFTAMMTVGGACSLLILLSSLFIP